ncbi:hypothetical protein Noda2021_05340 [Candidatus Dependentiae bacterium Noda2021]|nr:hypothetical protein Noda2021_05340 [Candidatus Dependentiae bacterium Noda2021]
MKKIFLILFAFTSLGLSAQESLRKQKLQYYFNLSVNYLRLAHYFADKALKEYDESDVDTDHIKELNKIRYQYQLLAVGLNPFATPTQEELNEIAHVHTAIDFDLLVDPIHGKTVMQHIEEKTLDLCKAQPSSETCIEAKKTFNAFKDYLSAVFEELKKYEEA